MNQFRFFFGIFPRVFGKSHVSVYYFLKWQFSQEWLIEFQWNFVRIFAQLQKKRAYYFVFFWLSLIVHDCTHGLPVTITTQPEVSLFVCNLKYFFDNKDILSTLQHLNVFLCTWLWPPTVPNLIESQANYMAFGHHRLPLSGRNNSNRAPLQHYKYRKMVVYEHWIIGLKILSVHQVFLSVHAYLTLLKSSSGPLIFK